MIKKRMAVAVYDQIPEELKAEKWKTTGNSDNIFFMFEFWLWICLQSNKSCHYWVILCFNLIFHQPNLTLYSYYRLVAKSSSHHKNISFRKGYNKMPWTVMKETNRSCMSMLRLCKKFPPKARQSTGVRTEWIHPGRQTNDKRVKMIGFRLIITRLLK